MSQTSSPTSGTEVENGAGNPDGSERVAVVAAGAGARGAYEAGALSVLVPWLHAQSRPPSIFVGTSAGAINAVLFAAVAHLDPREGSRQVLEVWRSIRLHDVFASPIVSFPLKTAPAYIGQALGLPGAHVESLLDTTPMSAAAEHIFEPHAQALHENIHGPEPVVDAIAVAATDDRDRTRVFVDLRDGLPLPAGDAARAIDYERTLVTAHHVLASSAIPVLFPAVALDGHCYRDGGVRLNAPLKPAIDLGATRLAVVATHPASYENAATGDQSQPTRDLVDGIADVLAAVLVDRMVEDLHTLGAMNERVPANRLSGDPRRIPYVFVGPDTRHEIGEHAAEVYRRHFRGVGALQQPDIGLLHRVIGPRERDGGDLLSYIFFDHAFVDDAITLGIRHASAVINAPAPWRTSRPRLP